MNKLTLGFSPCPNDTFMFDAMVHGKVDTEGLRFDVVMEDIETLNERALKNELDATKISYAVYPQLVNEYVLLDAGSALGFGVGPLLISLSNLSSNFSHLKIAIPGRHTTANFLFSIFFPDAKNKVETIFSEIEDAVLNGKVDAGVIIHENRFTYEQKGLKKICDLGELWEKETHQPIPLGGIVMKRSLHGDIQQKLNRIMKKSVEYAFANPRSSYEYVKQHAQEMDEEVRQKHIALYVNKFSVDLGDEGKAAVETFLNKAKEVGMIKELRTDLFFKNPKLHAL